MKKFTQYIIIGGIGLVLVILYFRKKAISAKDLSQGGGGGGAQLSAGNMLQKKTIECLKMNPGQFELCGQMVLPL